MGSRMRDHRPNVRRFARRLAVGGIVCALFTSGCRTNQKYELIEAELRTRERELADARAALAQSQNLLRAYEASQRTAHTPGAQPAGGSGAPLEVKEIAIARGTGGVDEDGAPGDEGLLVVIVPKDDDGSAVKVPGRAVIAAWETTPAGLKNPIGSWDIPADKLRRSWKSGLISTGYFVAVPWQTLPANDRVRVAVRLTTADGRAFEADRDVSVKPPLPPRGGGGPPVPTIPRPPGGRMPLFPDPLPPGTPSGIPPGTEELPPPAPFEGERGARLLPPVKP